MAWLVNVAVLFLVCPIVPALASAGYVFTHHPARHDAHASQQLSGSV
jgi:hypothetical protein